MWGRPALPKIKRHHPSPPARSDLSLQIDLCELRQRLDEVPLCQLAIERLVVFGGGGGGGGGLVGRSVKVGEEGVRFGQSVERELRGDEGERNGEISGQPQSSVRCAREGREWSARFADGHKCLNPLAHDEVVHEIGAHLGCGEEEAEELGVVALRDGVADCESVFDGRVALLRFGEIPDG